MLFLLFYIGLQIDLKEMRDQSGDILWLTALNTVVPFLMGMAVMLGLGYGWLIAFVIGLTRMPTAEAVIVPILDEFKLIHTRVGEFIIGAGVLDDVIEVFMVALVSVWIGQKAGGPQRRPGGFVQGLQQQHHTTCALNAGNEVNFKTSRAASQSAGGSGF